ncbi:hypothetical protein D1872_287930 [compost metagenome]
MLVEFLRREAFAADFVRVQLLVHAESHQLRLVANKDFFERMLFDFIDLEHHVAEQRIGMHVLHVLLGLFPCSGHGAVDAFGGNQDAALDAQILAVLQMFLCQRLGVIDLHELII